MQMENDREKEKQRTEWFWAALQKFCERRPNVYCSRQVAEFLARKYYIVLERDVRPKMKGNGLIECAKIISGTEYCTFASLPVRIKGHVGFSGPETARQDKETQEINLDFAIFLANAILEKHLKNVHEVPSINALIAQRASFLREHRKCLLNQPPPTKESFPVFFNAQIWNAIHDICILDPTGAFQVGDEQGKTNSTNGEDLVSLSS